MSEVIEISILFRAICRYVPSESLLPVSVATDWKTPFEDVETATPCMSIHCPSAKLALCTARVGPRDPCCGGVTQPGTIKVDASVTQAACFIFNVMTAS